MLLRYHHVMNLEDVFYGRIKPDPERSDKDFRQAYRWLEKEVGFYPLFLAVGAREENMRMTGYQNQWMQGKQGETKLNTVLFSFEEIEGVFTDYDIWHLVLGAGAKEYKMPEQDKQMLFKKSWSKARWLKKADEKTNTVQIVTPKLDLRQAGRIWVRNRRTKEKMEEEGFIGVEIKRIKIYNE
ncbi:hypothetical protein HZB00_01600 [Candidatus Woesearchaeota archaeon]|nr:hypothetical protein [Candidatus Woesearchaeota archaeon]